jgi:hypothetical protein
MVEMSVDEIIEKLCLLTLGHFINLPFCQ